MKRFFKPSVLLGIILALGLGFIAANFFWQRSVTEVTIRNDSGQEIRDLRLILSKGSVFQVDNLKAGDKKKLRFFVQGENGFHLIVRFRDAREIAGEGYLESGYRVTESIREAGIRSEYKTFSGLF